jgi:hypothetical protein
METIVYNIDSRNRNTTIYPSETKFTYDLNDDIKNITSIELSSAEFGNTSYVFSADKDNNYLKIDNITYEVPDGNYLSSELLSKINELVPATIEFTLDTNTGKVTITTTDTHIFLLSNKNNTHYKSLGELLGFTDLFFSIESSTKTSTNIMNVIGEHYYLLKINDIGHIYHENKKYFSKMIINAPKFEVVYETRNRYVSKKVEFKQPINLRKLEIELVDTFGHTIVTNGIDHFSFTLEFKVIRNETLKRYKMNPHYSKEVQKAILYDKMLDYFNKKLGNKNISDGIQVTYLKLLKNDYN